MESSSFLTQDGGAILFLIGAYFVVPVVLGRFAVRASWLQIGCAYPVWFVALWLMLGGPANSAEEGVGWTLVMGMFFTWAGVPIAAILLRAANMPYRLV
jgi:hypothetical protein